jgi:hypothetical protein
MFNPLLKELIIQNSRDISPDLIRSLIERLEPVPVMYLL